MHPKITELLAYLDARNEILRAAYESIPPGRRAARPAVDRWSAAEIVHHLEIVERRLLARLASMVEQARALPPDDDVTPFFPNETTSRVEVRDQRFTTSASSEPRDSDPARVWSDYMDARSKLKAVIGSGDGLQLGAFTAAHPALGALTGYEWIAFAGSHAARHADQVREVAAALAAEDEGIVRR